MSDYLEKLERLTNLFERGALSKEEFETEKAKLLGGSIIPEEDVVTSPTRISIIAKPWFRIGAPIAVFCLIVILGFVYFNSQRTPSSSKSSTARKTEGGESFESNIKFTNAASCQPTDGFQELLDRINQAAVASEGSTDRLVKIAGHEQEFEVQSSRSGVGDGAVILARILISGNWQGLNLQELRTSRWDDGKTQSLQLRFAGDAEKTASALKQLGFPVLDNGKSSRVDGTFIALETLDGMSVLTCVHGSADHDKDYDSSAENETAVDV